MCYLVPFSCSPSSIDQILCLQSMMKHQQRNPHIGNRVCQGSINDYRKCMFVDCLRECEPIGRVHPDVITFECVVVDSISRSRLISFKDGVCSLVLT